MEKRDNELLIRGIEDGRKAFIGPGVVQIDLCGRCNNTCIGCWVHSPFINDPTPDKDRMLAFDRVEALIRDIAAMGTKEVFLSGAGEPFLYPRIRDVIRLIKSRKMKLNIITNASLLSGENARALVEEGVDRVTASVWAGSGEGYAANHPGKDGKDFELIRANLAALAQLKAAKGSGLPEVKIYDVVTSRNCGEIRQMVEFAIAVRAQSVEFQAVDIRAGQTDFLSLSREQTQSVRAQFKALDAHPLLCFKDIQDTPAAQGELKEFGGRFCSVPAGFRLTEYSHPTRRTLTCGRGVETAPSDRNPRYDAKESFGVFSFPKDECALCPETSCPGRKGGVRVDFLSILGYRSFMRRLGTSLESGGKNEEGTVDSIPCFAGWVYSRVLSTGDVIPCCKAAFKKSMGSIHTSGFRQIWNSPVYQLFREKAVLLPKSDPYFAAIDCHRSCDNIGMNLMLGEMLRRHAERGEKRSVPAACGAKELPEAPLVSIPAKGFVRGNFNRGEHEFGAELIIDGGGKYGYAEYEIEVPETRMYELWSCYASGLCRPVKIQIDGATVAPRALAHVTEGWTAGETGWFREAKVRLSKGPHTLRIVTLRQIPHIRAFALCAGRFRFPAVPKPAAPRALPAFIGGYRDLMGVLHGKKAFVAPFHVQIDLTNACNNDCIACWCNSPLLQEKRHGPEMTGQTMPYGMVCDLLDELAGSGTKELYFSGGGEPFMHPRIMDVLAYAGKKGFICYVNTNFTLIDEERVKRLACLGVDHLTVSTWSATPATYAATHGNKTRQTFQTMMENLTLLNRIKRGKPLIKLYNVIFNMNYHELPGMVELARRTGSESVEFTLVDTIPGKTDKLLLDARQSAELRSLAQELAARRDPQGNVDGVHLFRYDAFLRRISSDADLAHATYDRNAIDTIPCYVGWCFSRVVPNGDVHGCLKAHRIPVGNLYSRSFSSIWNGREQREFRAKTRVRRKSDPFFRLIGNDPDTKEAGCYKSCDDIGRNLHMHDRISSLSAAHKAALKAASLALPASGGETRGPEQVVVDLTNRCNQRCLACWMYSPLLSEKPDPKWLRRELGYGPAAGLIDDLSAMGTQRIRFTGGGEPLLHPRITDILKYAKRRGLITCLTTNLSAGSRETRRGLAGTGLSELAVSVWAGDDAEYRALHPGAKEGDFSRLMEDTAFICRSEGAPQVTLCHVITPLNHKGLETMYREAAGAGAHAVYFTLVDLMPGTRELLLDAGQRACVLEQALHIRELASGGKGPRLEFLDGFIARLREAGGQDGEYDKRVNAIPCYAGVSFSRILADGSVCPCCRGVARRMGNINGQRFRRIWESPAYGEFRRKALYLPKTEPYFLDIGCMKMCDNLMHNEDMHRRVEEARRCLP